MGDKKEIKYWGTLILEGGVRIEFEQEFRHCDDVFDWILSLNDAELPLSDLIYITEAVSKKAFIIPREKVLAYCLED